MMLADALRPFENAAANAEAFGPDEVGAHPVSASPFGVADLAGNVWEWVSSREPGLPMVFRGGGFYEFEVSSRSSNREPAEPTMRDHAIGVRLCADAPPE